MSRRREVFSRVKATFTVLATAAVLVGCGGGDIGNGCTVTDPAPPDVSGAWNVTDAVISQSTCSSSINSTILALIEGPTGTCEYQVDQTDNAVQATDCNGNRWPGCVDETGFLRATQNLTSVTIPCTTLVNTILKAEAGESPSTVEYDMTINFSGTGCGVLTPCEAVVTAVWER